MSLFGQLRSLKKTVTVGLAGGACWVISALSLCSLRRMSTFHELSRLR